jgi:hypothetical protein
MLVPILLLTACSTTNYYAEAINSWQGSLIKNLAPLWGPADRVINMPGGNTYYVYVNESYQNSAPTLTPGYATYTNSAGKTTMATLMLPAMPTYYVLQCTTWFEVNNRGTIISAHAKGNYCFSDAALTKSIENPTHPISLTK